MAEDSGTDGERFGDFLTGDPKLSMWIPAELAGRVVGRGGIVIANIQRETQLKLMNALKPVGSSNWVALVMMGALSKVKIAYKAVADIVQDEVDDVVMEFTLQKWKRGFLLGNIGYAIVKRISAETNVRVYIAPKEDQPPAFCSLEGTFDNVNRALDLFREAYVEMVENKQNYWASVNAAKQGKLAAAAATSDSVVMVSADATERPPRSYLKKAGAESGAGILNPSDNTTESAAGVASAIDSPKLGRQRTKPWETPGELNGKSNALHDRASSSSLPPKAKTTVSVTKDSASSTEEAPRAKRTGVTTEKFISIPSNLVGLLLARRPDKYYATQRKNVMNQIQTYTLTTISRIGESFPAPKRQQSVDPDDTSAAKLSEASNATKEKVSAPSARRRRAVNADNEEDDDDDDTEEEDDDDDGSADDDSAEYEDAIEGSVADKEKDVDDSHRDATSASDNVIAAATEDGNLKEFQGDARDADADADAEGGEGATKKRDVSMDPVPFRVRGMTDLGIDLAIECINEIIAGKRIKVVLMGLKHETRGHVQFQRSIFVPSKFAAGSLSRSKFPGPRKPSHRPSRYVDADEIGADGGAGDGETSDLIPKVKRATGLSASKAERAGGRGSDIVTSGGRFESTGRGGGRGRGRGGRGGRGRGRGGVEDPSLVGPAAGGEAAKSGAATD